MSSGPSERALSVAQAEADDLAAAGAQAVILTGSHARGDAHPESDLDLRVIGEGPSSLLKRREEFLISIKSFSHDESRAVLRDPAEVGQVVPGWRSAVLLHDPEGLAGALKQEAEDWDWASIDRQCDDWVAEEVTDYAEEVHTLVSNLDLDRRSSAAAERSQLALHLAQFLSVHHRMLYESENQLWDPVAAKMGDRWGDAQAAALAEYEVAHEDACKAAMELFGLAAEQVSHLLDAQQKEVVDHACKLAARHASGDASS